MKHMFFLLATVGFLHTKAQQSDIHFSHTASTTAAPEKIWRVWTDVPNWKQWDKGLKEAILNGEFKKGTKGKLVPDKGPRSTFIISELDPGVSYTFKTRIPFGWLIVQRTLEVKDGITHFTHDVEFTGPFKKLLGKKLGKNYRAMLPEVMQTIQQLAEQSQP